MLFLKSVRALNIVCLWLVLACHTYGYFPTQWRADVAGNGGVSHITQTNQAFEELAAKYFPNVKTLTAQMRKVRDFIGESNAKVDDDQKHSAPHFDGENFEGGQDRLVDLRAKVVAALQKDEAHEAHANLGSALHTLQDFYSHSNWVELGNSQPHPDLGRGPRISQAAFSDATCKDCDTNSPKAKFGCPDCTANLLPSSDLLTSGYYFGEIDAPPEGVKIPKYKCHHGGVLDNTFWNAVGGAIGIPGSTPSGGINKDSLSCLFSPHYYAHQQSVQISIDATKQYIEDIKGDITEAQLKLLFGVGPTLAFVIDTTSSMNDIIADVRERALSFAQENLGTPDEASLYVVSPFNDPFIDGQVTKTSDFDTFVAVISSLGAEGGGDCPEPSMAGLGAALDAVDVGASVFLFTDAEAKDENLRTTLEANAESQNIKIYPFKFDSDCDEDDSDDSGSLEKRHDPKADDVYGAIALATGGQYFSLPRSQAGNITGLIRSVTRTNANHILKIADTICTTKTYKFPVDTQLSEFTVSLRGVNISLTIAKPDGSTLDLSSSGVSATILSDGKLITVEKPTTGYWAITIPKPGNFTIDVIGVSELQLSSFNFVQIAGRPGHTGYYPIIGPPAYDHDVAAVANVEGASFSDTKFDFRDPSGQVILSPGFQAGSGELGQPPKNSFFGVFHLKATSAFAYVTGKDASGAPFQRVLPSLINPYRSNTAYTGIGNSTLEYGNSTSFSVIPIANATGILSYPNSTSVAACPASHTSESKWNATTSSSVPFGTATVGASATLRSNTSLLVNSTATTHSSYISESKWNKTASPVTFGPGAGKTSTAFGEYVSTTEIEIECTLSKCTGSPIGVSTGPAAEPTSNSSEDSTPASENGGASGNAIASIVSTGDISPTGDHSTPAAEPTPNDIGGAFSGSANITASAPTDVPVSITGSPLAVFTGGVARLKGSFGLAIVLGAVLPFVLV